ncbi:MAG TPA: ABC transporter permease [Thermoanaerobaculia bacterium]|nr:ABC transporter permease [Thermoanaerobaculia bacterium]
MKTSAPRSSTSKPERAAFALFLLAAVLPIAASLAYAFLYTIGLAGLLSTGFSLHSWARMLGASELWTSFGLSIAVAAAVVTLATAGGLALSLVLRGSIEGGPLGTFLYLPLALPYTVAGFVTYQLLAPTGLFSRLAFRLGWVAGPADFPALTNDRFALGILAAHVALALPFMALLFTQLQASERVDRFAALARSLGATPGQALRRVVVPMLLSRAATPMLLLFVVVLGSYEIPLLLGRQAPQMLSVLTYRKWQRFDILQKPEAFVVALVYTLFALAVLVAALRRTRTEEHG